LSEEPLSGKLEHDKALIYGALQRGRGFLGYEQPGAIAGFAFWARSGGDEATMGEAVALENTLEVRIRLPAPARLRLLRDGQVVTESSGDRMTLMSHLPGVYRIEAYRRYAGRKRGWIFSNPIYVH
jgi:hypothetical protein